MSTSELVREAGAVAVTITLLLSLIVVVLRLAALPLVLAAQVLDRSADLFAVPLNFNATTAMGRRCRR